ncbi:DUF2064 domain-containing protein [Flavobacterium sp.]|uniref:TIGR04282 family arsenosugar biosynthesis glycosyltransferase n=1 Tax=Flavobacterium sp. TaxID=239 RepID=UPI00260BBCCD|nr:DUF2064 domain-containing protein [Flavobacterium sp.]MDG2431324.1 DUF2064 domain-containing protein [Flavobacterium sp.]
MKDLKTAILIFAHSAEYEATVKPFLHSKEVFESLNQRTLALAKKSKLPYFIISEKEQIGNTFGERFTNAIQAIYDLKYDSVIAIGNDSPNLTQHHISNAHQKLVTNDLVIGSSVDGGFYLLGIKKQHFDEKLFLNLPWQSQNLNGALLKLYKVNGLKTRYLEQLRDLDSIEDLKILFCNFKAVYQKLFQLFLLILSQARAVRAALEQPTSYLFHSEYSNKGSPCLAI